MTDSQEKKAAIEPTATVGVRRRRKARKRLVILGCILLPLCMLLAISLHLYSKASTLKDEMEAASALMPKLQQQILNNDGDGAAITVADMMKHTAAARDSARDPLWSLASSLPIAGTNFEAASVAATSADDVARLAAGPLVGVAQSLNWRTLFTSGEGLDIRALESAEPVLSSAAHAVRESHNRLASVNKELLIPQVAEPLTAAQATLASLRSSLDSAASTAAVIPSMMGADEHRSYLLMVQNNAELRASGGIPGALAVIHLDKGKLSLGTQRSAGSLKTFTPPLDVDPQQSTIYTSRVGKYMQDVNLTPDFPTAARTAVQMWEAELGEHLDGALSIDPIALSFLMKATGPINLESNVTVSGVTSLPAELTTDNVVSTLLSDVYKKVDEPALQDEYFAGVAQQVFAALASGKADGGQLAHGVSRAVSEGRLLVWSAKADEQGIIARYAVSGSVTGPSVAPAQFGVYFNDGTGAKMDYYVQRSVRLVKQCPKDGYEQTIVRITSTNTAPANSATSLPAYVTGGGNYGVPPGSVLTNITAYGPVQAVVETAHEDGSKTNFAPYLHGERPVGVLAVQLSPGETKTVEFAFGKIVQHTEPTLFVTPTVQPVKDVALATEEASCGQSRDGDVNNK